MLSSRQKQVVHLSLHTQCACVGVFVYKCHCHCLHKPSCQLVIQGLCPSFPSNAKKVWGAFVNSATATMPGKGNQILSIEENQFLFFPPKQPHKSTKARCLFLFFLSVPRPRGLEHTFPSYGECLVSLTRMNTIPS